MAEYKCQVCAYLYGDDNEDTLWNDLPDDWSCPVCGSPKKYFQPEIEPIEKTSEQEDATESDSLDDLLRPSDEIETYMTDIHQMADTGRSITEPMRTRKPTFSWDDILIKGAQLATIPLNKDVGVNTTTKIGPAAEKPLVLETPVFITHMSFGALSREAKIALAQGSAAVNTAMCSGEGGILPESIESAYKYIFEYVPNLYSVNEENLQRVDAIEIKFGQSAKPGMGGHLPASKVTPEIANIRGREVGIDIRSHYFCWLPG
jgi:glutamate synthase domain-containing protein 2